MGGGSDHVASCCAHRGLHEVGLVHPGGAVDLQGNQRAGGCSQPEAGTPILQGTPSPCSHVPGRRRQVRAGREPGRWVQSSCWGPGRKVRGRTCGVEVVMGWRLQPSPLPSHHNHGGCGTLTRSAALWQGRRPRSRCPRKGQRAQSCPTALPPKKQPLTVPHPALTPHLPRRCPEPRLSHWAQTCPGSAVSSALHLQTCRAGGPGGLRGGLSVSPASAQPPVPAPQAHLAPLGGS